MYYKHELLFNVIAEYPNTYYNVFNLAEWRSMVDLLFLGIIPGTSIQISFENWLWGTALLALLGLLWITHKKRLATYIAIYLTLYYAAAIANLGSRQTATDR
jgi:hypothetical protein